MNNEIGGEMMDLQKSENVKKEKSQQKVTAGTKNESNPMTNQVVEDQKQISSQQTTGTIDQQ